MKSELIKYARESLKSQLSLMNDVLYPASLHDAITAACSSTIQFLLENYTFKELEEIYEEEQYTFKNGRQYQSGDHIKSDNLRKAMTLLKLAKKENKLLSAEIPKMWPSKNFTFKIKEELNTEN